jgi:quercetin dioxygenase-like cupin family protein
MSATEITLQDKIQVLKAAAQNLPQVVMPTKHFLVDGMYLRQILIPAGTAFVGRKHRKMHYFMVLRGGAWVTGDDEKPHNLQPGMVLLCKPGAQRVGVTYEDTIFVTVHRTEETLLKNIEDDCVEFDSTSRYGVGNEILQCLPEAS